MVRTQHPGVEHAAVVDKLSFQRNTDEEASPVVSSVRLWKPCHGGANLLSVQHGHLRLAIIGRRTVNDAVSTGRYGATNTSISLILVQYSLSKVAADIESEFLHLQGNQLKLLVPESVPIAFDCTDDILPFALTASQCLGGSLGVGSDACVKRYTEALDKAIARLDI